MAAKRQNTAAFQPVACREPETPLVVAGLPPLVRHGFPHHEPGTGTTPRFDAAEKDAAVASVEHQPPAVLGGGRRAEGGGGDEAGHVAARSPLGGIGEEAEHRGRAVELAEPAAEAGSGDEAAPGLADERGADEARGIGRREAEKKLLDEILRHRHAALPGGPHSRAAGKFYYI